MRLTKEQFTTTLQEISGLETRDPATIGMLALIATLLFEQTDVLWTMLRAEYEKIADVQEGIGAILNREAPR